MRTNPAAWLRGAPFTTCLLACACAETLEPTGADPSDAGAVQSSGNFQHSPLEGGGFVTVVDATDTEAWQHLDLDTGLDAPDEAGWDLSFSRFRVRVNGGVTGEGGVRVAARDVAFEGVTETPEDLEWSVPVADGPDDDDGEADNLFNNGSDDWYDYDLSTHTLTPKERTYFVATTERRFFKVALDSYYDDAGSPGIVRFRWAELGAVALGDAGQAMVTDAGAPPVKPDPLPEGAFEIDASSSEDWVYLAADGTAVNVVSPDESLDWDLALRRTSIRTNSGTSGPGVGGLRIVERPFAAIDAASTFGFTVDAAVSSGRPGAPEVSSSPVEWFDYDPTTHTVTPKDVTLVLRAADGSYAKFRIHRWEDGVYALSVASLERDTSARILEIDASDRDVWRTVSLRDGAAVDGEGDAWDLAISRTLFRTNGGTSGDGEALAHLLGDLALDDVTDLPSDGTADVMIAPARPGAASYSGNATLADWFDYDPMSHVVSPKPLSFAIRAADGSWGAMQIQAYDDGRYTLALRYAGPGQSSL